MGVPELASHAGAPDTSGMGELGRGFRIGDCEVRPEDGTVHSPSGLRRLGPRPMHLLMTLAAEPGKVFSREELMTSVWSGLVVSDETLSRCISDLRQALEDDPRSPRYIETLARRGYRLIERPRAGLDVPMVDVPEELPAPEQTVAAETAAASVPGENGGTHRVRGVPWRSASLAVSLALLLALGAWLLGTREAERVPLSPEPAIAENGIAVLPFANLSDDPDLEYFSDGLSEELIHRFASVEALAVVARTSAFAFKGTDKDVREIGRALGVAYVLEGSVRRHGDRIRIGAQLIDVRNGFHLFSRVYERPFSDLFAIQENVALEVGSALEPRLSGLLDGLQHAPEQTTPEALEAYLLGKHLQRKHTAESLERAAREFRRAIDVDPDFARAHAGLAETLALTSQYAERPIARMAPDIEAGIARALELDPRCAEAWHARGLLAFYENRLADALEAFHTAQSLDPNATGSISMQAWTLRFLGRNREALAYTTLALRNDPINVHALVMHAYVLGYLGEFDEAERLLLRTLEIDPAYLNAFWGLGYLKWHEGSHAAAVGWYEAGIERGIEQSHAYTELGRVLLELGDHERSREWIETGLARAADPVGQLDALVAWHQYAGDFAGLAAAIHAYGERFPQHPGMARYRALAALLNGDAEAALREYEAMAAGNPESLHDHWDMASGYWHALFLARARQMTGDREGAERTLDQAEERLGRFAREAGFPGIVAYYRAAIASLRHDTGRALGFLEQAGRSGWRRPAQVRTSPLFAALRGDERSGALLGEIGQNLEHERLALAPGSGSAGLDDRTEVLP